MEKLEKEIPAEEARVIEEIDLMEIFDTVLEKKVIIGVITLIFGILGFAASMLLARYEATVYIRVNPFMNGIMQFSNTEPGKNLAIIDNKLISKLLELYNEETKHKKLGFSIKTKKTPDKDDPFVSIDIHTKQKENLQTAIVEISRYLENHPFVKQQKVLLRELLETKSEIIEREEPNFDLIVKNFSNARFSFVIDDIYGKILDLKTNYTLMKFLKESNDLQIFDIIIPTELPEKPESKTLLFTMGFAVTGFFAGIFYALISHAYARYRQRKASV